MRLGSEDLDELAGMFAERDVWRFEYDRGLTREESEAFLNCQTRMWAECGFGGSSVRERDGTDLVGVVGLGVPTVAQELLPDGDYRRCSPVVWGRGFLGQPPFDDTHVAVYPVIVRPPNPRRV